MRSKRTVNTPVEAPPPKRHRKRRLAWWLFKLVVILGFALIIGFVVFAQHVASLAPKIPEDARAIVVLTGGKARLQAGIDLLADDTNKRLLISGVNTQLTPDSVAREFGIDRAMMGCCVDIGYQAQDTLGNAAESAGWIAAFQFKDVIVVTNNYHMPRSLMELRRAIPGVRFHPYPVINSDLTGGRWVRDRNVMRVLFTEYIKFLAAFGRNLVGDVL